MGSAIEIKMEDEINLLDYWRVFVKWKKAIALIVAVATFSAVIISFFLPKNYKAEATIVPIGGQGLSEMGATSLMAVQLGVNGLMGGGRGSSQLLVILRSRTLAERVIEKYQLMKEFFPEYWQEVIGEGQEVRNKRPTMEDAVSAYFGQVSFREDKKSQLIIIQAVMENPSLAARVVNGHLDEFADYLNENIFTTFKRNRIYIGKQLERNQAEFLESGRELATFYDTNRISNVVPTVDVDVSLGIKGDEQESIIEAMKKVDGLQKQVEGVNAKIEKAKIVQDVPQQVYFEYLTNHQILLQQINALLAQQYEMAKIKETKEDLNFQVVDWARVPERKFKPERKMIVVLSSVMAFFLAIFYAFVREYLEKTNKTKSLKIKHD